MRMVVKTEEFYNMMVKFQQDTGFLVKQISMKFKDNRDSVGEEIDFEQLEKVTFQAVYSIKYLENYLVKTDAVLDAIKAHLDSMFDNMEAEKERYVDLLDLSVEEGTQTKLRDIKYNLVFAINGESMTKIMNEYRKFVESLKKEVPVKQK